MRATFVQTIGKARRSQAVSTFGVGTIVDFPGGSYMPLGLDEQEWQSSGMHREALESLIIHEPRLQKLLNVRMFRSVPVPGDRQISEFGRKVQKAWTVPSVRFPCWLECPKCHRLGTVDDPFAVQTDARVLCGGCNERVNPVRFITACVRGHIDDFPWISWAHSRKGEPCQRPVLFLKSRGKSAALGDLNVKCISCGNDRSLAEIFMPHNLKGFKCRGNSPWLKSFDRCSAPVITLQRGGSNVHFPVMASMLSIPPASEAIAKILERFWPVLRAVPEVALEATLQGLIDENGLKIKLSSAVSWVRRRRKLDTDDDCKDERSARLQEYEALGNDCPAVPEGTHIPDFENRSFPPPPDLSVWFDRICAVSRLREVRAYCGFTRINPLPLNIEKIAEAAGKKTISPLYLRPVDWRPAVEVRGEGIFFRLNEETLSKWSNVSRVRDRADKINHIFKAFCKGRDLEPPHRITPRLLLVHSLAHVLIRRLSLDSGYSSASLRERLYISEPDEPGGAMAGILVYTASPDSDGSLGGLVSMAEPVKIDYLINRAIKDAFWCGNDPVCNETDPGALGERFSGASCHSCLLVPETACEKFNRELDRVMLVGSAEEKIKGYFSDYDPG